VRSFSKARGRRETELRREVDERGQNVAMNDPGADVGKKLDEVVGTEYDAGAKGLAGKLRAGVIRWIVAALLALAMVAAIIATIEAHRLPPEGRKIPPKPIVIQIIPGATPR